MILGARISRLRHLQMIPSQASNPEENSPEAIEVVNHAPNGRTVADSRDLGPFIEGEQDVIGFIAISHFLLSSKDQQIKEVIPRLLESADAHDVDVFRSAAKQNLVAYTERTISSKVDLIRDDIYRNTYHEVMKSNFDYLLKDQDRQFGEVIQVISSSGSAARQIIIALVAAFVFGVVISLARLIEPPITVPGVAQGTHLTGNASNGTR